MFIQVKLLKGYAQPLTYKAPDHWPQENLVGRLIRVPFRTGTQSAIIVEQFTQIPSTTFTIREAVDFAPFPQDSSYNPFISNLGDYYQIESLHFIKRIQQFLIEKEVVEPTPDDSKEILSKADPILTAEQQHVVDFLIPKLGIGEYTPALLHGVTGSGKTEIYKKLIRENFARNNTSLLLLPEVSLALQFEKLMRAQLPAEIPIYSFHSATSPKAKRLLWQSVLKNQPILIIGVHLPILLPIPNLGLILVDEEHESGYQEKKHPKIHTRDAAILRAHICKIPIVLGSATPSLASLYNAKTKGWHFFELKKRFAGSFPQISKVLLTNKNKRRNFWISKELDQAITEQLEKKEQTIIFLNRRGFSFFVQCKGCSFIFQCNNCSVSLTLHDHEELNCHYCGLTQRIPPNCPSCKKLENQFLKKGIGTQQIASILSGLFPQARIERADLDTTSKKTSWQATLQEFYDGDIDILVGTQTITKGYHFPNVTLVGLIWADINLNFPMYNAAEIALQQLIQVAGRAGRQRENSKVIIQAMADHTIFQYMNEIDYIKFYDSEVKGRKLFSYPPHKRFVEIELKYSDEHIVDRDAHLWMKYALELCEQKGFKLQLLGPAKPPVHKIKNMHSRKLYIKGEHMSEIIALFKALTRKKFKSSIYFTPNPTS